MLISTPVKDKTFILGDENIQSKPVLRIFFSQKLYQESVWLSTEGIAFVLVLISIAEVKSVENKQC